MRKYIKHILLWGNLFFAGALLLSYLANYINPAGFWHVAFFGLSYPFLLFVNVAWIVFWLWRKKALALISIVAILLGVGYIGRYLQIRLRPLKTESEKTVKLLTYNVRLFNYYQWEKQQAVNDSILKYVKNENADIVCFQEFFTDENNPNGSENYIGLKLSNQKYKHIYYNSGSGELKNYGIATYSKYPIIRRGNVIFKNSFNTCIYTDVVIDTDTLRIFNVHLQSIRLRKDSYFMVDSLFSKSKTKRIDEVRDISGRLRDAYVKRAMQVDEVRYQIDQSPYPVVVCGDFNDTPVSYTYQKIRGDMADAFINSGSWTGNTYRGDFPSFRIDFIFHSCNLKTQQYNTRHLNLSDHYPVSCSIGLD